MERVLGLQIGIDNLVYLDDKLMFCLDAAGQVCALFTERVHFFGHIVTAQGIKPDPI